MTKKIDRQWKNRIVGEGIISADQLKANPKNWRTHGDDQRKTLDSVLDEIGWIQRVIVNKTTGNIVDGHLRVEQALANNEDVPVVYVELSQEEEMLALATIDSCVATLPILNLLKSVWDIGKDRAVEYVHPTQKPVDLAIEAIDKTTLSEQIILDLFGGSGSTLIACESTNRHSRMMELDPKYCDVIIKRYQDYTGDEAVHEDGRLYNDLGE